MTSIKEVRETINALSWACQYFQGGTARENARCNLPQTLADYVRNVNELVIPPRFSKDVARRDDVLASYERTMARWQSNQRPELLRDILPAW